VVIKLLEKLNTEFAKSQESVEKSLLGIILFLTVDGEKEVIANANADKKIAYINKAYNQDLQMMANDKIFITGWRFFNNVEQVDITLHKPVGVPIKEAVKDEKEGE
jgi:uncharacterized membrane protein